MDFKEKIKDLNVEEVAGDVVDETGKVVRKMKKGKKLPIVIALLAAGGLAVGAGAVYLFTKGKHYGEYEATEEEYDEENESEEA